MREAGSGRPDKLSTKQVKSQKSANVSNGRVSVGEQFITFIGEGNHAWTVAEIRRHPFDPDVHVYDQEIGCKYLAIRCVKAQPESAGA